MSEQGSFQDRPTDLVGRFLLAVSRWLAIAGGLVLVATALVTIYSIVALQIFGRSFAGDVEVVSYGLVIAVFLFLPYSQMVRGHVIVDIFTVRASSRVKALLDALGAIIFAVMAGLLAWRMSVGGVEMFERTQTTASLNIPYWWSFPVAVVCLGLLVGIALYTARQSVRR